jgi:DNA polymerase III subunit epsilon
MDARELAQHILAEEATAQQLLSQPAPNMRTVAAGLTGTHHPALDSLLSEATLVVFDVETTGMDRLHDRVVAMGAVRVLQGELCAEEAFFSLVDPQMPIPRLATRIHHITDADIAGQPRIEDVLPAFRVFVGEAVPVAHVAGFDLAFLKPCLQRAGLPPLNAVLDTSALAQALYPTWPDAALETLSARLGVPLHARHTAVGDSVATARVAIRLTRVMAARGVFSLAQALVLQGGDPGLQ